jgi:hypothetical protein
MSWTSYINMQWSNSNNNKQWSNSDNNKQWNNNENNRQWSSCVWWLGPSESHHATSMDGFTLTGTGTLMTWTSYIATLTSSGATATITAWSNNDNNSMEQQRQ